MKRIVLVLLLLGLPTVVPAIDPETLEDPVQQRRYEALIHELRCLKCQGETIADTPADFAADIRRQVRTMIVAGQSDTEVKQFLVDRYGELILLKPRSLWLWITPALLLLGGGLIAWRVLSQRRSLLANDTSDPDAESRDS